MVQTFLALMTLLFDAIKNLDSELGKQLAN